MVNAPSPPNAARDATTSGVRGVLEGLRIVDRRRRSRCARSAGDGPDAAQRSGVRRRQRGRSFRALGRERPDVLISDIAMPEEDGYMLIASRSRARSDGGGRTPAIAVTAYAGPADRRRALAAASTDTSRSRSTSTRSSTCCSTSSRASTCTIARTREQRRSSSGAARAQSSSASADSISRRRVAVALAFAALSPDSSHSRASSLRPASSSICPHIRYIAT